ncbi:ribosome silencing factor [Alkalibacterium kapii]|uniref:Ribosomal silencing factor RsfS n=1 Tax=Alkalibacterium kapii TaxID=426704 RepID=A0A511AV45_9LACT|nr:ribosome silencing factor [Alkalibacterium kapii]GEK92069.1 ribosomal silencing factor RsfS [Alkalibacterium kapii]
MTQNSMNILERVVKAADSKQANDIVALDMKKVSLLADYFVILDANNERQLNAIAQNVLEEAAKNKREIKRIEGKDEGKWILIDLGDVVVHLFNREERELYKLERLWSDADYVDIQEWLD